MERCRYYPESAAKRIKECEACQHRLAELCEDDLLIKELQQRVSVYEKINFDNKKILTSEL